MSSFCCPVSDCTLVMSVHCAMILKHYVVILLSYVRLYIGNASTLCNDTYTLCRHSAQCVMILSLFLCQTVHWQCCIMILAEYVGILLCNCTLTRVYNDTCAVCHHSSILCQTIHWQCYIMTLAHYVVILLSYVRLYNRNICSLQTVPDTVTGHPGLSHWGCALTVNTTDCPWPRLSVSWSCLRLYSGHNNTHWPWPWLSVSWSCLRLYSGHNYTLTQCDMILSQAVHWQ